MEFGSKALRYLPRTVQHLFSPHLGFESGWRFGAASDWRNAGKPCTPQRTDNPLMNYFVTHSKGPGIWKWLHYFDIYHRHLQKFRGTKVNILEIGIYSGGSLGMWRDYLGPGATIYGVDIEPTCQAYANEWTRVFIGDQGDRQFWRTFKTEAPAMDIVIDDGGHQRDQQIVTLEELLPAMNPGGVYLCEDIHGTRHKFASFVYGLADRLNAGAGIADLNDPERRLSVEATGAQCVIESITLYPFVAVLTRALGHVSEFVAPKHGTEWQPFLR